MKLVLMIVLGLMLGATVGQFVKLARWPFRIAFWLTVWMFVFSLQS